MLDTGKLNLDKKLGCSNSFLAAEDAGCCEAKEDILNQMGLFVFRYKPRNVINKSFIRFAKGLNIK